MRRPLAFALVAFALCIVFGLLGRSGMPGGALISGLFLLVAIAFLLALLPFWNRMRLLPMPGLFLPVRSRERWCAGCGRPAPKNNICTVCGSTPRQPRKVWPPGS